MRWGRGKVTIKETELEVTVTLKLSQEKLKEIFGVQGLKFTKKKADLLAEEILNNDDDWLRDIDEAFEDVVTNWLVEMFEE
jgi:hypothetical protein